MLFILISILAALFLFLLLVVGVFMSYKVSEEQCKISQELLDYTKSMGKMNEEKFKKEMEYLDEAKFSTIQREIREVELQRAQLEHLEHLNKLNKQ